MKCVDKHSMTWYFDRGLERKALLLDASNLDWFEFPLFDCIKKEIYRTLEDPNEDMDWGYSYPGGKTKLRELIAKHESYIENTLIEKGDVIVVGNGVTGVLNFLAQMMIKEGRKVNKTAILYPVPAYAGLMKSLDYYEYEKILINTKRKDNYCLTYNEVVENYTDNVIAVLITNPGNPACNYMDIEELKKIINFAKEKKIYIILDAIFEEAPHYKKHQNKFVGSFLMSENYEKLIKIKGFSKDIPQLSDLRLGWSICKNKKVSDELLELDEITNFSNSTFLESLAIVEMQHRVWIDERTYNDSVKKYMDEKELYHNKIFEILKEAIGYLDKQKLIEDIIIPDIGNILFVKLSNMLNKTHNINTSHDLFVYILEQANILVTPGHVFGLPMEELWFRVTISREKEQFMNGLKKIIKILGEE